MDVEEEEEPQPEPEPVMPPPFSRGPFAVPNRPLGKFMTPQVPRQADFGTKNISRSHVRYSVGGFTPGGIYGTGVAATPGPSNAGVSGPRRVRVVEPWKVNDITVTLNDTKEESREEVYEKDQEPLGTPHRRGSVSPTKRERLTEEERKVSRTMRNDVTPECLMIFQRLSSSDASLRSRNLTSSAVRHLVVVSPSSHLFHQ